MDTPTRNPESTPVIAARGLTRRFGHKTALNDVDLQVPAGQVCALLGRNGAGKTTFIRCALGLLPPSKGAIDVLGAPAGRTEVIRSEQLPTRVLIVTTFSRPGYLQRALNAGVAGYVLKDSKSDDLAGAVRAVARGERHVPTELAALAWTTPDPLTDRERQVLQLAEAGLANKQIARELGLSHGTVRNYLTEAMDKLDAGNRVEAFRRARDLGWL